MANIILLTQKKNINIAEKMYNHSFCILSNQEDIFSYCKENTTDAIIVDTVKMENAVNICRSVKFGTQAQNIPIILIVDKKTQNKDFLKYGSAYVSTPIDSDLLTATINSVLLTKNSNDELSKNITDLSTNLYRLNLLNNTLTMLAGSLNKRELIEKMTDGIEKSLNFQLCYSLVFNDPTDITLYIQSLHPISTRLEEAIKFRAMLSYKELFNIHTSKEEFKVIKKIKRPNDFEYDLNVFNFDTAFAPVNVINKFFGIIEVFRENELKTDDINAFQTLVKQATLSLQSAVLYEEIKEQNDKLAEVEQKKSEYVSIIQHELKTPLSTIQNVAKILLSGTIPGVPDKALWFAKMIERNGDKLLSLIQALLDSSKLESGKFDYNFTVADINPIAEFIKQNLSNLAAEKNINFVLEKTDKLPLLYIDTGRTEQVINNLVSNAIKYTPDNGNISISTGIMDSFELKQRPFSENTDRVIADEYVIVKVSDNGPGIAKEDISRIFEKFEQVKSSLSRSVGGTGLGLYIAKEIAKAHNGFLWLESVVGQGSDFYFALPVLTVDEQLDMQLKQDISNADIEKKSFRVITLCENKTQEEPYLVDFIKKLDSDNVFKKTADSKYFYTETKERLYYTFYDVNMNIQIFNFVVQRIMDFAKKDDIINKGKKIYFSKVCYPDDGGAAEELIKKSKKMLKEVING